MVSEWMCTRCGLPAKLHHVGLDQRYGIGRCDCSRSTVTIQSAETFDPTRHAKRVSEEKAAFDKAARGKPLSREEELLAKAYRRRIAG